MNNIQRFKGPLAFGRNAETTLMALKLWFCRFLRSLIRTGFSMSQEQESRKLLDKENQSIKTRRPCRKGGEKSATAIKNWFKFF
jgi:hypothetical protein